jgi:hypothetical protein
MKPPVPRDRGFFMVRPPGYHGGGVRGPLPGECRVRWEAREVDENAGRTTRREFLKICAAAGALGALGALGAGCGGGGGGGPEAPDPTGTFDVDLSAFPALAGENRAVTVAGTPAGVIFLTHTTGATRFRSCRQVADPRWFGRWCPSSPPAACAPRRR